MNHVTSAKYMLSMMAFILFTGACAVGRAQSTKVPTKKTYRIDGQVVNIRTAITSKVQNPALELLRCEVMELQETKTGVRLGVRR